MPTDGQSATAHLVRLNKYLADNGIASRRGADRMIEEGEVMIDGKIVTTLGMKIDPQARRVEVDGVVLKAQGERHRYYLLSKPSGVLCTNDIREGRKRAIDLIGDRRKGRIYTVGRLDESTTGLVILTNDGDFANRIGHPRYGVPKTYKVTLRTRITNEQLDRLRRGINLSEYRTNFDDLRVIKRTDHTSILLVRLNEGRNREIRRAFAGVGLDVRGLHRERIGPVSDRGLKIGNWRPLTRDEINGLQGASMEETRPKRGPTKRRRPGRQKR